MKTNILILSATHIISGAEIVLKPYLEDNPAYGFYLYTSSKEAVQGFYKTINGIKSMTVDRHMTNYLLRDHPLRVPIYLASTVVSLVKALGIIKNNDIKIVYGNNGNDLGVLIGIKLIKGKDIKVISHIHNQLTSHSVSGLYVRWLGHLVDTYIVPSKATRASLLSLLRTNVPVEVVYNGVTPSDEMMDQQEVKMSKVLRLGFVGGLSRRKRPDLFLDIIEALQDNRVAYEGVILGPVLEETVVQRLKERIEKGQLSVQLLPPLAYNAMEGFYKTLDCLLLTSDADPLPTVLIEGMNAGVMVAARDVDGVGEIIDHGVDGLIFDYDFEPEQVAMDVVACLNNLDQLKKYKAGARQKVSSRFNIAGKKRQVNRIIEELLNK